MQAKDSAGSLLNNANRVGVAFFYDPEGIVDEYMFYLLKEMQKFTSRMVVVINDPVKAEHEASLLKLGVEVLIRENTGFDVYAYKAALAHIGFDALADFDELLLFNHTFFGPIFPFEEMFSKMEAQPCDFWGVTAHKAAPSPFTDDAEMPWHLQSHFIAVRKRILREPHFRNYWWNLPPIETYEQSIMYHEIRFTPYFRELGYEVHAYVQDKLYESANPIFDNIDLLIENRCPIIKRRTFFHDYVYHEKNGVDLPRALRLIRDRSSYNLGMIWRNILRSVDLRTLNANAVLTSIFPDVRLKDPSKANPGFHGKVAVCVHIFYPEMAEHIMNLCDNIPGVFDVIVTTDTKEKAEQIRTVANSRERTSKLLIRILDENRGRDMAALFVGCRDLFAGTEYDLVCRLHTKKSPQDGQALSNIFKRHLEENLLASPGYVQNIFDMFEESPWIGLAFPPVIHIGYPTLGQAWFTNKPTVERLAAEMDIAVKLDVDTPVAPYGGMYWFRPKALRKLFMRHWAWDNFPPEPIYHDGDLPHGLERLLAYVAQDEGFITQQVMSISIAEQNYVSLEYKLQKIGSTLGGTFHQQYEVAKYRASVAANPVSSSELKKINNRIISLTQLNVMRSGMLSANAAIFRKAKATYHILMARRLAMLKKLRRTDIFDQLLALFDDYAYLLANGDIANSGLDPFQHYFRFGLYEERDPHPLFSNNFYRERYLKSSDKQVGEPPIISYLSHGVSSDFMPHPLFDPKYYIEQLSRPLDLGDVPLLHFLREGAHRGLNPHPAFVTQFYVKQCPDIDFSRLNPLVHFLLFGGIEGRDPSPDFDSDGYLEQNFDVARAGMNPLFHYLTYGFKEGRRVGVNAREQVGKGDA